MTPLVLRQQSEGLAAAHCITADAANCPTSTRRNSTHLNARTASPPAEPYDMSAQAKMSTSTAQSTSQAFVTSTLVSGPCSMASWRDDEDALLQQCFAHSNLHTSVIIWHRTVMSWHAACMRRALEKRSAPQGADHRHRQLCCLYSNDAGLHPQRASTLTLRANVEHYSTARLMTPRVLRHEVQAHLHSAHMTAAQSWH